MQREPTNGDKNGPCQAGARCARHARWVGREAPTSHQPTDIEAGGERFPSEPASNAPRHAPVAQSPRPPLTRITAIEPPRPARARLRRSLRCKYTRCGPAGTPERVHNRPSLSPRQSAHQHAAPTRASSRTHIITHAHQHARVHPHARVHHRARVPTRMRASSLTRIITHARHHERVHRAVASLRCAESLQIARCTRNTRARDGIPRGQPGRKRWRGRERKGGRGPSGSKERRGATLAAVAGGGRVLGVSTLTP